MTHFSCDVSKTPTVRENILHAFSLDKTGPDVEKFKLSKNMHIQCILEEHDPHETQERLQQFNYTLLQIGEG